MQKNSYSKKQNKVSFLQGVYSDLIIVSRRLLVFLILSLGYNIPAVFHTGHAMNLWGLFYIYSFSSSHAVYYSHML